MKLWWLPVSLCFQDKSLVIAQLGQTCSPPSTPELAWHLKFVISKISISLYRPNISTFLSTHSLFLSFSPWGKVKNNPLLFYQRFIPPPIIHHCKNNNIHILRVFFIPHCWLPPPLPFPLLLRLIILFFLFSLIFFFFFFFFFGIANYMQKSN